MSPEDKVAAKKAQWWDWHKQNPEFWVLFERFTFTAIRRGHKRLSPWLIVNRIRWETTVETRGSEYKISNDFIAFFSRYFMYKYPAHLGFFRTKRMAGERGDEWRGAEDA